MTDCDKIISIYNDSTDYYEFLIKLGLNGYEIDDSFKKIIITKDIVATGFDDYGIFTVNIYEFLLNPEILEKFYKKS